MKPVYETESRSSNRWVVPMTWAFGVFLALSFCGMAVAQVAVQPTPPVATPPHPPIVVPSAALIRLTRPAPIAASPDAAVVTMAAPAPPAMKWEYKFAGNRQQLAELGKESWELVAVTQPVNGAPTFYLKRPLGDGAAADPNRGEEMNRRQSELRQERIATLKAVVEIGIKLASAGKLEIRDVSEARMSLLKAELDAAETDSDRIALYKETLVSLKQLEAMAKAAKEAARATELDRLAIQASRLEVEIWLEQPTAVAGALPPSPNTLALGPPVTVGRGRRFPGVASIRANHHSVMVAHELGGTTLFYVLYYAGKNGFVSSVSPNPDTNTAVFEGRVRLKNGHTFSCERESLYSDKLMVNHAEYDLSQGRVFVLHDDGTLVHLPLVPALSVARDPKQLAALIVQAGPDLTSRVGP